MSKWVAFLILTSAVCAGISCPDGTVASTSNDECWLFVAEPQDFVFAQKHCQDQGGNLTSIHNKFDNILFADVAKNVLKDSESVITGGNNLINRNSWTWINGDVFDFSAWADSEPANVDTDNCLHVDTSTGFWYAKDCRVRAPFVCSLSSAAPTTANSDETSTTSENFPTTTIETASLDQSLSTSGNPNFPTPAVGNSAAYQQASEYFANVLNPDVDPCEDFYNYTCGVYDQPLSFLVARESVTKLFYGALTRPVDPAEPLPVKLVKKMFTQCMSDRSNWTAIVKGGSIINGIFNEFKNKTGFGFPLMDKSDNDWPCARQLGNALGYLAREMSINSLISSSVDLNSTNNMGPYVMSVDQPSLYLQIRPYIGRTWNLTKPTLFSVASAAFRAFATLNDIELDPVQLEADVNAVLDFEHLLANEFMKNPDTKKPLIESINYMTPKEFSEKFQHIDISAFFETLAACNPPVQQKMADPNFEFNLIEPGILAKLDMALNTSFNGRVRPKTFYNYLGYRILLSQMEYLPLPDSTLTTEDKQVIQDLPKRTQLGHAGFDEISSVSDAQEISIQRCLKEAKTYMENAANRVLIDEVYPTDEARATIKRDISKIANGIKNGMQSMIDGLEWMTPATKQGAYAKIEQLVTNIAFKDEWLDDEWLTAEYANLNNFLDETSYIKIMQAVYKFLFQSNLNLLLQVNGTDRHIFGITGDVNAWYLPWQNSITFPAGILRFPFYDPDWPRSIIYGSMGVVAGHELSHGFDLDGVQFDAVGNLNNWMDAQSKEGFNNMTECVVREYNDFCPLDAAKYSPNCVNGQQTAGENTADNAGIHAAYRAYKNSVAFNGEDPRLPGPLMSQFNHDQLFFLSFSRLWCKGAEDPNKLFQKMLIDPHSPPRYRIFGTLQNYPAFRNAFNCPVNTPYAPEQHCNVWISDITRF